MNRRVQSFKKTLGNISRFWAREDFNAALQEVDRASEEWPGNAHLHVLRASLIQLQQSPAHTLDDAKQTLREAMDLDPSSPAAAIELGNFLDAVEDDPKAASKAYAKALDQARRLLMQGLIGQAKALLQLERKDEALRCVAELLRVQAAPNGQRSSRNAPDFIVRSSNGDLQFVEVKGRPYAAEVEQLVNEVMATR